MVYLVFRLHQFTFIRKTGRRHRSFGWVLAVLFAALPALFAIKHLMLAEIILLHIVLSFLICDFLGAVCGRITKSRTRKDISGTAAVIFAVIYLGAGWFLAHHVFIKHYTFETDKNLGGVLRIAEITDAHLGATLSGADFSEEMKRVQAENPDLVVIVGDFVDDDSDIQDMKEACQALGELKTTYGVYFVYGNHDNGYYRYRNFNSNELRKALKENGVTILEDETELIGGRFYLTGRRDRSFHGRTDISRLLEGLDTEKYTIVLDHQPNDFENEAASSADLVLCGHTHGGHIFPAGIIGLLMKANDRVYGTEIRNKTRFVVSSGISGWAIPLKTGTHSEIVIIDITEDHAVP